LGFTQELNGQDFMCGICGFLNFGVNRPDEHVLSAMIDTLKHRGPDERGVYCNGPLGLGHARLSIIDLCGGHQPMRNADGRVWITFNGEIFNYLELRKDLEERGHHFTSHSDTEVILHCYQEDGEECVRRFNGQWAFAIWDDRKKRLFLSRDRLGVRPLYYAWKDNCFVFGSEVKALFSYPGMRRQIDFLGLNQLFTLWCTLPPRTVFKGIEELPPGGCLIVEQGRTRAWSYWQMDYSEGYESLSDGDLADKLRALLTEATKLRLRADVPVGAYLSGGLDSTIVTSIIRQLTDTPLKTFSLSFEASEFDERKYQQEAVQFLNTNHQEIRISGDDIAQIFPDVIHHTESPILRTAPAPLFLLSKLVRQHGYKVVVSGEGSDEIFGGYDIYKEAKVRRFWAKCPESRMRPLLLKRLYPYLRNLRSQPVEYLKAFFHIDANDLNDPLFSHLPRWELTARIKAFFSEEVRAEIGSYDVLEEIRGKLPSGFEDWDPFGKAQFLETRLLLPGYILSSQGDRVGMAHSVEGRFPFLDHRVVETAGRIPPSQKMKVLNEKYILKLATRDLIPASARIRKKQPYRAPDVEAFFSHGKARQAYIEELFDPERIRRNAIFNPGAVMKLCAKVKAGAAAGVKDNMALTAILSTQLWVEQFISCPGTHSFSRKEWNHAAL
jgi:asparagine synthase (glutamine-hydrolysing)